MPRFHFKNFCRKEATFQPLVVLRALSSSRLYSFTSVKFSLLSSSGGGELPMNGLHCNWLNGHQFSLKIIFTFPFLTMDPSSPLPTIITKSYFRLTRNKQCFELQKLDFCLDTLRWFQTFRGSSILEVWYGLQNSGVLIINF